MLFVASQAICKLVWSLYSQNKPRMPKIVFISQALPPCSLFFLMLNISFWSSGMSRKQNFVIGFRFKSDTAVLTLDCPTFWVFKTEISFSDWGIMWAPKGKPLGGVWGYSPPENSEILILLNAISTVLRGQFWLSFLRLFLFAWLTWTSTWFYFIFRAFFRVFCLSVSG